MVHYPGRHPRSVSVRLNVLPGRLPPSPEVLQLSLSSGPPPPSSEDRFSTLRGLDQSLNPQLNRYAHETDYLIAQARADSRLPVFQLYPDVQVRANCSPADKL